MPPEKVNEGSIRAAAMVIMGKRRPDIELEAPLPGDNISGGSIDKITQILRDYMGENLDHVREIFKMANKQDIPPSGVVAGYKIAATLSLYDIDVHDFASWLIELYTSTRNKHKMDTTQFGELLALAYAELKDGKTSPKDLPMRVRQLKADEIMLSIKLPSEQKVLEEVQKKRKEEEEAVGRITTEHSIKKDQIDKMNAEYAELDGNLKQIRADYSQAESKLTEIKVQIISEQYGYNEYVKIRELGFRIFHLSTLREKIAGIMKANGIDSKDAVQKFIDDTSKQYDTKLGFELEVERMKTELQDLGSQKLLLQQEKVALTNDVENLRNQKKLVYEGFTKQSENLNKLATDIEKTGKRVASVGEEICGSLESTRDELLATQKETVASVLPIESLAPIGKAMSGEKVPVAQYLGSMDHEAEFLLDKIPKGIRARDDIAEVRRAIHIAVHFLPKDTHLLT